MKKILLSWVGLALLANVPIALAGTWSCDFSVDTCDFTMFVDDPDPSTSLVNNGQLIMHTNGQVYAEEPPSPPTNYATAAEAYMHQLFTPGYGESWWAEITGMIPAIIEPNYPVGPMGIDHLHLQVGLAAGFVKPDGSIYLMDNGLIFSGDDRSGLEVKNRKYDADSKFHPVSGDSVEYADAHTLTMDESGLLGLRFDAATKVLTAYNGHTNDFLSVDIDASGPGNWNMTDSDDFFIALLLEVRGLPVPETSPLALDNFHASSGVSVPEPTTWVMMLYGLGLVSVLRLRGHNHIWRV
ncbi:PEP-CTERM sorting domain-containing protein [endosymbiont of Lamellibrachia barhami]|uniref:PEP-CTERM sorting domain-containing protein n=1 Tax=endosymbiont of Lamellibrachia barhami TaxID=205975 RepID=UPI0015B00B83|nr:PEP-CTERM sorting domain-containing protein [endosymbiont of Lamellibrachia barhami]